MNLNTEQYITVSIPISALSSKIKSMLTQVLFTSIAYLKRFQAFLILVFLNLATLKCKCYSSTWMHHALWQIWKTLLRKSSSSYLGHDVSIAHVQVILLKCTVHTTRVNQMRNNRIGYKYTVFSTKQNILIEKMQFQPIFVCSA